MNTSDTQDIITQYYTTLIQALCDLSESYYRLGRLEDASKLLRAGTQFLASNEVMPQDTLRLLLSYGKILNAKNFYLLNDYELTLPTLLRAKELAESINDKKSLADALQLIGEAHYNKKLWTDEGEYETALGYFQQALELREVLAENIGISESLFYSGIIYERYQQPDNAFDYYTKALQITEQSDSKRVTSYVLRHLAGIYLDRNDLEKAEQYFTESLVLRQEDGFKILLPMSHLTVGNVYQAKGDLANASTQYEKAADLAGEMKLLVPSILSLLSMGDVRKEQGELEQAHMYFEKALADAQAIDLRVGIAEARTKLAEIAHMTGA